MNKKETRKKITEQKKCMPDDRIRQLSDELTERFCSLPDFQKAACLYAYISYNQEVCTDKIIARALADGKKVAVPRVSGDHLKFYYISSEEDLESGTYGIREPKEQLPCADGRDRQVLMLMPGLAFDRDGGRIGYGKGLYDRYLAAFPDVHFTKIALCYDFQLLDHIETEPFDQKADLVIAAPSE